MSTTMIVIICGLLFFSAILFLCVPFFWRRHVYFTSVICLFTSLLFVMSASIILLASVGIKGYHALTREELAATVYVKPLGSQQFQARIVRAGRADTTFIIAGDELYIDSRILKWKPFANILGVHTFYQLDRISGRYRDIVDETTKLRTLYSLSGPMKPWDLYSLATRYKFIAPLIDAQYGSATFVAAEPDKVLKVMVTTSGLLIRDE